MAVQRRSALYRSMEQRERDAEVIELATSVASEIYANDGQVRTATLSLEARLKIYRIAVITGVVDKDKAALRAKKIVTKDT